MPFVSCTRRARFTLAINSAITREDHIPQERTPIRRVAPTLVPAFQQQDQQFSAAFSLLREAIAQRAFPAASIAVTQAGKLVALKSFGKFVFEEQLEDVSPFSRSCRQAEDDCDLQLLPSILFDLASLTKVVATTTIAMILCERGLLELESPISGVLPEFRTGDRRRLGVTFRMLLAHSSGLPAYEKLFLRAQNGQELLQMAFTMPLSADPATRAEYSDIGFIILGVALERLANEPLGVFCQREIFGTLPLANTTFNPAAEIRPRIPPTADERQGQGLHKGRSTFRNRIIQGEVQDENAFVLGGVAGHAGLFSSAEDVAHFAHVMLWGGSGMLRPETIELFTRREISPAGTSRALGWDTPSPPSQSGKHFGPHSYGHLGYTGTSLWIDPEQQLSVTLLTNRTWPDCSNHSIKQVRPRVHDAVVDALDCQVKRKHR